MAHDKLVVSKKKFNSRLIVGTGKYRNMSECAKAIEKSVPCDRISLSVIGLEVPHVHVHLIPIKNMDEATFKVKIKVSDKKMQEIADRIKSNF